MAEKKEAEKSKRRRPGPPSRRPESKRHKENKAKVDKKTRYPIATAISLLKNMKKANFDESVEVAIKLGIDPTKTDQLVRGSVSLPKGTGKEVKVLVFAEGEKAEKAIEAGADVVGGKELVERIQKENFLDFDIAISATEMMGFIGKLGRILGPKGKMPSPKAGTVTPDVAKAVKEFKTGKVEYRTDKSGNVHVPVGKLSFNDEDLVENIKVFVDHIKSVKPSAAKGTYIKKVAISSSIGPGLLIEVK